MDYEKSYVGLCSYHMSRMIVLILMGLISSTNLITYLKKYLPYHKSMFLDTFKLFYIHMDEIQFFQPK